jgi:uncharacterized protein (DUF1330 family)
MVSVADRLISPPRFNMPALTIFNITITDPVKYADYAKHTPRIIAEHGGKMLVRGGDPEVIEGSPQGQRVVVLEFVDRAAARAFYNSGAYQNIIGMRMGASVGHGVIVDTFPGDAWTAAVAESKKHG